MPGKHSRGSQEPRRSYRPMLTAAAASCALLTLGAVYGPFLFAPANPTPAPPDFVTTATTDPQSSFIFGLITAGVDITGEEQLALSAAHHACENSEAAATSPESVATVAAVLSISSNEATKFVEYSRLHCEDLP